jgi:hypothetical protein
MFYRREHRGHVPFGILSDYSGDAAHKKQKSEVRCQKLEARGRQFRVQPAGCVFETQAEARTLTASLLLRTYDVDGLAKAQGIKNAEGSSRSG